MDSNYAWDKKTNRYRNIATGVFVSSLTFRTELDLVVDKSIIRVKKITEAFRIADIDLPEWQMKMAMEVKYINMAFGASAYGGFNNISANEWDKVSETIDGQLQYLQKFAEDLYTGEQAQNASMSNRASLYMESARATYENQRRFVEQDSGMTEEANILAAGDNCNGCVDATLAGWQPIGSLPPIGGRQCQSRCRCNMIYRNNKQEN